MFNPKSTIEGQGKEMLKELEKIDIEEANELQLLAGLWKANRVFFVISNDLGTWKLSPVIFEKFSKEDLKELCSLFRTLAIQLVKKYIEISERLFKKTKRKVIKTKKKEKEVKMPLYVG